MRMPSGDKSKSSILLILQVVVTISLVMIACHPGVIFDHTKIIPGNVWNQDDKVKFEVPVQDTYGSYKFFLNIRHTTDYRYANIYFFIDTTFPDGTKSRDTVECILAKRDGKWIGKGLTSVRDNQILLRRGLRFPEQGIYIFEFEQAMREENLQGITDIGIRIEKD